MMNENASKCDRKGKSYVWILGYMKKELRKKMTKSLYEQFFCKNNFSIWFPWMRHFFFSKVGLEGIFLWINLRSVLKQEGVYAKV